MNCPELTNSQVANRQVNFDNYALLHYEGKQLIRSWFDRAWESHRTFGNNDFEAFIFVWFSFNGWASCVTNTDRDAEFIKALSGNSRMNDDFKSLVDNNPSLAENAREFTSLLPIFDIKTLKHRRILTYDNYDDRAERVEYYLNRGITQFEPACWKRHKDSGEDVPLDWKHILKAIYKVRCNLFHGQKAVHSEMDRQIVSATFLTLFHFITEAGYLHRDF